MPKFRGSLFVGGSSLLSAFPVLWTELGSHVCGYTFPPGHELWTGSSDFVLRSLFLPHCELWTDLGPSQPEFLRRPGFPGLAFRSLSSEVRSPPGPPVTRVGPGPRDILQFPLDHLWNWPASLSPGQDISDFLLPLLSPSVCSIQISWDLSRTFWVPFLLWNELSDLPGPSVVRGSSMSLLSWVLAFCSRFSCSSLSLEGSGSPCLCPCLSDPQTRT